MHVLFNFQSNVLAKQCTLATHYLNKEAHLLQELPHLLWVSGLVETPHTKVSALSSASATSKQTFLITHVHLQDLHTERPRHDQYSRTHLYPSPPHLQGVPRYWAGREILTVSLYPLLMEVNPKQNQVIWHRTDLAVKANKNAKGTLPSSTVTQPLCSQISIWCDSSSLGIRCLALKGHVFSSLASFGWFWKWKITSCISASCNNFSSLGPLKIQSYFVFQEQKHYCL